jgi:hypothetical protein
MPVIAVLTGLGMMKQEQGLVRTRVGSTSGCKSRATDDVAMEWRAMPKMIAKMGRHGRVEN